MLEQMQRLFPGINLRPAMACELSPYGVLAARQDATSGLATQFIALRSHVLAPAVKSPNILERPLLVAALSEAVGAVAERGRQLPGGRTMPGNRALTLIVPDATARVLLLDFDSLPSKRVEALSILRFRLRKLVPFEVEDAAVTWQPMAHSGDGLRLLVIVMPREVLREYESVVREAGYIPGVVLPSTLAAMPLIGADPALVINRNGNTLTTAILRGQDLLLHRSLDFAGMDEAAAVEGQPRLPRSAESRELLEEDDIRQSVSVALAYFEDTLAATPSELFYIGPGSAREFGAMLGEPGVMVRELGGEVGLPAHSGQVAAPRSLLAPVTGALLNA